jgi:hypothetical protein
VIIKGDNRLAMAKKFRIVEIFLIQSPGRLGLYVDRVSGDDTSGWVDGTGNVSLADGIKITIVRNDRSGALIRFSPNE